MKLIHVPLVVFLTTSSYNTNFVLIDHSAVTNHMTCDPGLIEDLRTSTHYVVSSANGNPSRVIGEGFISLTDSLIADSVLGVPEWIIAY